MYYSVSKSSQDLSNYKPHPPLPKPQIRLKPLIFISARIIDLAKARKGPHHQIDVFVLELPYYMEVGPFSRVHARMAEPFGDRGDGNPAKQKKRRMRMPEPMDRNDWDGQFAAVPCQRAVDGRVEYLSATDEYRLVVRHSFQQCRELRDNHPIDLYLPDGGFVLSRLEAPLLFVIPRLRHRKRLVREIEITRRQSDCLGKPQARLGYEKNEPIEAYLVLEIQVFEQ